MIKLTHRSECIKTIECLDFNEDFQFDCNNLAIIGDNEKTREHNEKIRQFIGDGSVLVFNTNNGVVLKSNGAPKNGVSIASVHYNSVQFPTDVKQWNLIMPIDADQLSTGVCVLTINDFTKMVGTRIPVPRDYKTIITFDKAEDYAIEIDLFDYVA